MSHNIQSMTGYARDEASHGAESWVIELRSVNGKSLDFRPRLPTGFDWLEAEARKRIGKHVARGSLSLSMTVKREAGEQVPMLNVSVAQSMLSQIRDFALENGLSEPVLGDLLLLRGVVEMADPKSAKDDAEEEVRRQALVDSMERVFAELARHREQEGQAMLAVISGQLDQIADLTAAAKAEADSIPGMLKRKLQERLDELLKQDPPISEERMAQELALLITRADIREEIDRLAAHVDSVRSLLATPDGPAIGRKLDFMAQEFNRESNTICSKASSGTLTSIGVELKTVIDQFREQIQNIQ